MGKLGYYEKEYDRLVDFRILKIFQRGDIVKVVARGNIAEYCLSDINQCANTNKYNISRGRFTYSLLKRILFYYPGYSVFNKFLSIR